MDNPSHHKPRPNLRVLVRNFILELLLYGALVVGYFLLALRYLNDFLTQLFQDNLIIYGVLALLLIVVQGVLLDSLTTFLLNRIKLERME